jgi:preprotein translocase subunit SecG
MEQANLNIGTIGQKLEAARRSKGVSVSEAGQATKILSKFIDAMESDDFGALSAPVYAKSFIRMYAQYLGLDAQPLVDEYAAQHAPRKKNNLGDEVRQKLAQVDQVPGDSNAGAVAAPAGGGGKIFGGVNEAMSRLSGSVPPLKRIVSVVGGVLLLVIILLSVKQCAGDEEEEPATVGGAASMQHDGMTDAVPDVYLVKPGEIEIDR